MVDVTHLTRNPTIPPLRLQEQGMLMQELSIPKRTYGGHADALRRAKKGGYVVKQMLGEGDVLPTTEALMNDVAPLKDYLPYTDSAWVAGLASLDVSNNALKLFNIVPDQAAMAAGASGGGVMISAGGKPALDLGGFQGRGMAAPLNPDDFNVYAAGRALAWVGTISAVPGGTGQVCRVISGTPAYMSFGVVPGGTAYRVVANRRIGAGGALQQATVEGGAVALGTLLKVLVLFDIAAGRISLQVNGATVIDSAVWGDGEGILDAASVTAQLAVPGASNTQNVQHRAFALLNTRDATIGNAVLDRLAAAAS